MIDKLEQVELRYEKVMSLKVFRENLSKAKDYPEFCKNAIIKIHNTITAYFLR